MIESPSTRIPPCTATITSGTVLHPDDVGADRAQHAVLGARLEVRPRHGDVHAFAQHDSLLARDLARQRAQRRRRTAPTCRESAAPSRSSFGPTSGLSPSRLMWSAMSIRSPGAHSGCIPPHAFDTTSVSRAERAQHAHRKGHLLERVALVAVKAPLHRDHRLARRACRTAAGRRATPPWTAGTPECRRTRSVASTSISRASPPSPVPRMIATSGTRANRARTTAAAAFDASRADAECCGSAMRGRAPLRSFLRRREPAATRAAAAGAVAPAGGAGTVGAGACSRRASISASCRSTIMRSCAR